MHISLTKLSSLVLMTVTNRAPRQSVVRRTGGRHKNLRSRVCAMKTKKKNPLRHIRRQGRSTGKPVAAVVYFPYSSYRRGGFKKYCNKYAIFVKQVILLHRKRTYLLYGKRWGRSEKMPRWVTGTGDRYLLSDYGYMNVRYFWWM